MARSTGVSDWVVKRKATWFALAATAGFGAGGQEPGPGDQVIEAFDRVVAAVQENYSNLARDLCIRFELVDRYIGSQFDFVSASRKVLGSRHWPETETEQERFVDAFYDSLVAAYGELLIHFDSETFRFVPLDGELETGRFWLDAVLTFNDDTTADVKLQMYWNGDRWGIVDVRADTLIYSSDYRAQFWEHIYEHGFESLIDELEKKAAPRRQCGH